MIKRLLKAGGNVYGPLILLCAAMSLPLCAYYGEEALYPFVARFSLWDWLYSSVSMVVCGISCVLGWRLCRIRSAPFLWRGRTLWLLILYALLWCVFFNRFFPAEWIQVPFSVLFLVGTWSFCRAILGRLGYAVWIPCLFLLLLEYAASYGGVSVTTENLIQLFSTSWRDAKEFLTLGVIAALVLALCVSFIAYWVVDKLLGRERKATLLFCGMLCLCILFVGIRPLEHNMERNASLIWPLGDMEVLAYRAAQAQRDICQAKRLLDSLPQREMVKASPGISRADAFNFS